MLLSPSPAGSSGPGRISQILPTVKCSNCNEPVPLAELGEHVCAPTPPVPSLPRSSRASSQRTQSRVPVSPPPKVPIPATPSSPTTRDYAPSPLRSRTSVSSSSSDRSSKVSRPSFSSTHRPRPSAASIHPPTPTSPRLPPPPRTQTPVISPLRTQTPVIPPPRTQTPASIPPRTHTPVSIPARTHTPIFSALPTHVAHPSSASTIIPPAPEPDTKIGGEAGMAGVGRRGFAAAARAAMFANSLPNVPQFLDIDAAINVTGTPPLSSSSISSISSPVSPLSQFSTSPTSRFPPDDILTGPSIKGKEPEKKPQIQIPPVGADIQQAPGSPIPRLPFFEKFRNKIPGVGIGSSSPAEDDSPSSSIPTAVPGTAKAPPTRSATQDTTSESESAISLGLGDRTSTATARQHHRNGTAESSGSEYGLAYADSTDYEDESESARKPLSQSSFKFPSRSSSRSSSRRDGATPVPGPRPPRPRHKSNASSVSSASSYSDDLTSRLESMTRDRSRSNASSTSTSSAIAHALGLSQSSPEAYVSGRLGGPGAPGSGMKRRGSEKSDKKPDLGLQRFGLKDEGAVPPAPHTAMPLPARGSLAHRSNTVQAVPSTEPKTPKLPARAKTERGASLDKAREEGSGETKRRSRIKVCVKCEKRIEDGRWIQVDGGGVLCERCWKNMYLPKCRRCNRPIEKQAVSSSDGQLKGKYHKDCFNCFTCNKPFPDKTFYVYDGRPLCKYHYHESNGSLCAAATCGQPIEGPCAVSHAGDRYHPEHLLCEFNSPGQGRCKERLEEYWEVDGRMLCERHAKGGSGAGGGYAGGGIGSGWGSGAEENSRAMKRVTRFIDLRGVGDELGDLR